MKVFRGLGNLKYRNIFACSTAGAATFFIWKHLRNGTGEAIDIQDDMLNALDAEISANTSGRIWEERGMSIK
jgi:hypothetical protein